MLQDANASMEKRGESLDQKIMKLDKELARYTEQVVAHAHASRRWVLDAVMFAASAFGKACALCSRLQMKKMKPGPAKSRCNLGMNPGDETRV